VTYEVGDSSKKKKLLAATEYTHSRNRLVRLRLAYRDIERDVLLYLNGLYCIRVIFR